IGKLHWYCPAFTGLHPFDLRFEAREEIAGTEDDVNILPRTALKGLAVDFSSEIQPDLVAFFGDGIAFPWRVNSILLREPRQDLLDVGFGDLGNEPFDLDVIETADLDLRQNLECDGIGEIGLRSENLLNFLAVPRNIDLGIHG